MIFLHAFTTRIHACMTEASAVTKKSLDLKKRTKCEHVLHAGSENTTEVAIRPDKVEHFTHTLESLSPEIHTGMQIAKCG